MNEWRDWHWVTLGNRAGACLGSIVGLLRRNARCYVTFVDVRRQWVATPDRNPIQVLPKTSSSCLYHTSIDIGNRALLLWQYYFFLLVWTRGSDGSVPGGVLGPIYLSCLDITCFCSVKGCCIALITTCSFLVRSCEHERDRLPFLRLKL